MAFTATYTLKLNNNTASTPVTLTQAAAYFKIDGTSVTGGKDAGQWCATVRVYANQATRNNDLGDFIPATDFAIATPYVANVDPYSALYAVAKTGYGDAVDVI